MPLFKNAEDEEFVKILFRKAILHSKKCSELIDKNTTNWEVEQDCPDGYPCYAACNY